MSGQSKFEPPLFMFVFYLKALNMPDNLITDFIGIDVQKGVIMFSFLTPGDRIYHDDIICECNYVIPVSFQIMLCPFSHCFASQGSS